MDEYKPPFPWFGGKSKVAPQVWAALGDVDHYVEPFFGSGAVLFGRPSAPKIETVNDLDHWVANFWRAVQHDPEQVAHYADNPVSEDDLTARHIWLVKYGKPELDSRIPADPDYYDPKIAGWWVWGLSSWIGSGWCAGNGPWSEENGRLVNLGRNRTGRGVNRKRVDLGRNQGVNRPQTDLASYFQLISGRLKNVRVCSGDWSRVVTAGALTHGRVVGVFLDPPYSHEMRNTSIYNTDNPDIAGDVLKWCIENGTNKRYRVALCGYDGEHNQLERMGWTVMLWKAGRAYGRTIGETQNSENRLKERIWFSPNCIGKGLFDLEAK